LTERLGKDQFEILPHVSSMQLAFARIKESWDDAYLTSLSGRSVESILERVRTAEKVGLFSSPEMPPKRLAKILLENQIGAFRAYVCENLGQPDERVTLADLHDLQALDFDPLHVLILIRSGETRNEAAPARRRKLFGNPDELFAHNRPRRGLMTQCEARTLALSQLDIRPTSVVWDIGAGTGSVAIEAAQLADRGLVCAIEPDPTDLALAQSNAEKFGVTNIRWVAERAPQSLADLPGPDAVFVGATGRSVGTVVRAAFERLKTGGNLVLNIATLETVSATHQLLRELAGEVRLWQLSLARGIEQLDRVRFQAVNPTFLLAVTKQALPHPS
jgi:precorrin-6Y C5,15-methyltransferase (decarboxylating)